ncbi:DHH family phosphoesterase [Desulfolutivibrio sulfoxidireducens]|uniref:DHH family phosphoesterase n=1 Tax=Desulfolutivibrio sulfoxidireducens TaxID=2773299 RepID=UPI001FE3CC75|nr:DHH family phosphoesterase [Desulfolutivibrio sulfoxidireducens]
MRMKTIKVQRVTAQDAAKMCKLFRREDRWLILVNADPDAMGSAMALKRIMSRRVEATDIARVNEVTRPDNLAMIRFLRIPLARLTPEMLQAYDRFALVDSQPHHHPDFAAVPFSIVIDHHPLAPEHPVTAAYVDIRPGLGATCTILAEYLRALRIRPGKLLATALIYGIKTDTQNFSRPFQHGDILAFSGLNKYAGQDLLRRIVHSEFHKSWLKYFTRAFRKMRFVGTRGLFVFMDRLESPDVLVILADFFTRVHGLSWDMICGVSEGKAVAVFRGDGLFRDMGKVAAEHFGDVGSAGGHKTMARAEIDMGKLRGRDPEEFFWRRLTGRRGGGQPKTT